MPTVSEESRFRLSGEIDGRRRSFLLSPGRQTVGSAADRDVHLPVAGVSRRHAAIEVDEHVRLEDLGSKNGTFIEGRPVDRLTRLEVGQTVEFGDATLDLEEVELEDVELGLAFGSEPVEKAAPETASATIGRTVGVERQDPKTTLLIETIDRLWTITETDAALVDFARQTFSADAAALVEPLGETKKTVLAMAGDWSHGDPAGEDLAADGSDEPALGFSYFGAPDGTQVRGCLRLEESRRELVLLAPQAHDAVIPPLLHLMLLWSTRAQAKDARRATAPPSEGLSFPEGHVPGESAPMLELYERVRKIAPSDVPILLLGETGVGKEYIARLVHLSSPRHGAPLVAVNCAAIPADLLEAELFGITGGVATGVRARRGKLEAANGGTLLLDEIGDMPADLQAKLLRVLQEKRVEPLGGAPVDLDVRIIAATHADLSQRVDEGAFRRDLYYRLAGLELKIPPLRERRADLSRLIEVFAHRFCAEAGKRLRGITVKALRALLDHPWPGNVRELEHEIRRLVYLVEDGDAVEWTLLSDALRQPASLPADPFDDTTRGLVPRLEVLEKQWIIEALEAAGGNQTRAAERLEISRNGLIQRMKRLDIASSTGR